MVFNNTGVVDAESGVLSFNAGDTGNSSGSFSAQSGATVQFDGGTFTLTGSVAPGSGTLAVAAGTVNFEATYNGAGNITVSGGTANFFGERELRHGQHDDLRWDGELQQSSRSGASWLRSPHQTGRADFPHPASSNGFDEGMR